MLLITPSGAGRNVENSAVCTIDIISSCLVHSVEMVIYEVRASEIRKYNYEMCEKTPIASLVRVKRLVIHKK